MHLNGHHMVIPDITAGIRMGIGAGSTRQSSPPAMVNTVIQMYFNLSCNPNVKFTTNGGKSIAFTLKPIKTGEQLSWAIESNSTKDRKKFLLDVLKIECKCSRCQGKTANPDQRLQLVSDPAFRYIDANVKCLDPIEFNSKQIKPLMDAFLLVLQKYGRMDWCEELDYVTQWFKALYSIRSLGGGVDFDHPLVREFLSHCEFLSHFYRSL